MHTVLITLLCFFVALGAQPVFAQELMVMTEEFPPYQYYDDVDGRLIGISTQIVEAIQQKVGDTSEIKVFPWVRGLNLVKAKSNAALFSMLRTKEREEQYKWVGPLAKLEMVFFKKKGSPIQLQSVDDARKVNKIGVAKNAGNHDMLSAMGFTNLDVIANGVDATNVKKLAGGRIDLWPTLKGPGLYSIKRQGLAGELVPIPDVTIFEGDFYIAFNKNTDDAMITTWQKALDELIADGTVDAITKRY